MACAYLFHSSTSMHLWSKMLLCLSSTRNMTTALQRHTPTHKLLHLLLVELPRPVRSGEGPLQPYLWDPYSSQALAIARARAAALSLSRIRRLSSKHPATFRTCLSDKDST